MDAAANKKRVRILRAAAAEVAKMNATAEVAKIDAPGELKIIITLSKKQLNKSCAKKPKL